MNGWNRFTEQCRRDAKQWLFYLFSLFLFRLAFIAYFRDKIETTTAWTDILKAMLNGMRFDAVVSSYWTLIPFLFTVACSFAEAQALTGRVRRIFGITFAVLSTIAFVITIGYFREYNDQFNHYVFNLYYDDTKAILSTIWAEYHVLPSLIVISLVSGFMIAFYQRYSRSAFLATHADHAPDRATPLLSRIVISVLIVLAFVIGLRGSFTRLPLKLQDAGVTQDAFLNKAVINPYIALEYAYIDHQKIRYIATGLESYLPDRDIRNAARTVSGNGAVLDTLDDYLKKIALGPKGKVPRHIFLIVMESYDAWPLLKKYSSFGVTRELTALAENGIHIVSFLPASDGTDTSLGAIITGLPDASVKTQYQQSSRTPYPSAIAANFRKLGYRTRFFYGGYLSWQKIGDYVKNQGFEEVYGAPHMGSWITNNEWGVEDEHLFDFIERTVEADSARPSFNLIMSTSYHPPYKLDVRAKGFSLTKVPDDVAPLFDNSISLNMLGHLWYSDRCLGRFVKTAEAKLAPSLFAITGDHYGRKFINMKPDFFESSAVPLVLYGKDVLKGIALPKGVAGGHIDIGPTLIELAAPKGFPYYSVGQDLLLPRKTFLGIGRGKVIGPDFIVDIYSSRIFPVPDNILPKTLPDIDELKAAHNRVHGIAWWRIMRGEKLQDSF